MDNYESLMRRYINLHDNMFHLRTQLQEVASVLSGIEESLGSALNGKKFRDKQGETGIIRIEPKSTGSESGSSKEKYVSLVYGEKVIKTHLASLANIQILD
ncbi:hypothetical protein [Peribacillus kribbensis]|uniref:hypothetical protein n=1 Tax=Peribacillus kribbensis TaxID=356658 RepID=UPI00040CFA23|nr:hypothetical protein [Peribacillus kribbensis]